MNRQILPQFPGYFSLISSSLLFLRLTDRSMGSLNCFITIRGAGWNRQANAALAPEYDWFDDNLLVEFVQDIGFEDYAEGGEIFDGDRRGKVSTPEPGMGLGIVGLIGWGWRQRSRRR